MKLMDWMDAVVLVLGVAGPLPWLPFLMDTEIVPVGAWLVLCGLWAVIWYSLHLWAQAYVTFRLPKEG